MATDTLINILEQAQAIEERVEGIKAAYVYSPEAMIVMPCIVNYPLRGRDRAEAGSVKSLYVFGFEVHVCRGVLEDAQKLARPFPSKLADAFWSDCTMGGAVDTILEIRHMFLPLRYAAEWHMGIRFEVEVQARRILAI